MGGPGNMVSVTQTSCHRERRSPRPPAPQPGQADGRRHDRRKGLCWSRMFPPFCLLLWLLSLGDGAEALDIEVCNMALGMQSGEIPDVALSASSSYNDASVGPANARIRTETNGGAWCPQKTVSKEVKEFLQIDLGELKVITLVETQGRFGNGQGQEFADQYLLEYQREDNGEWFRFRNRRAQEIIPGNMNTYIAELREIDPPIVCRRLRFIPFSTHPKQVCMRVELYGCRWKDGTVSYRMPQGERRGTEVDLLDFTYDGDFKENLLSGGLGQLTDGEQGQSNFRLDPMGLRIKGYEWIGWRNETFGNKPVEIVFKFDAVRNFTDVRIHSNNMFNKDVRVFRMAKIHFSIGGQHFADRPIEFKYMRDTLIEYSRQVIIPLEHRIGRYVKIELFFDSKWLMISEVIFESAYAVGNFTEELVPARLSTPSTPNAHPHPTNIVEVIDVIPDGKKGNYSRVSGAGGKALDGDATAEGADAATTPDMDPSKPRKNLDDEYIGIIIGTLAALILILFAVIIVIIFRHRRNKANNNHRTLKPVELPRHVTLDLNDIRNNTLTNGKISNGNMYNCVATSDDTNTSREYAAVPDLTSTLSPPGVSSAYQSNGLLPRAQSPSALTSPLVSTVPRVGSPFGVGAVATAPPLEDDGAANTLPNIQGVSGNTTYAVPGNLDLMWTDDLSVIEFPRDKLKFVQKLGEGQFGEVHLCETLSIAEILGDDFLVNRTAGSMLVAVKSLRRNADERAKADFQREVKIMVRLKDPNIVRVLGVCTKDEPLAVVVEYMKFGDLNQFLQQHVLENTMARKRLPKSLSYGSLIYMASQVASGMKFLENMNMVHRDLATRNCLVGHNYTIKISDFGMSRSLYSSDYYRIEGKAVLPIRWMAWESVLLGKFSCKSDVWSLGVTLWEVLTFAREQPFNNLSDEQVIENCGHYFRDDGVEEYLPQPLGCPREIYDLMRECWNRDETLRPTFREIHMFLQRKNMGYNPTDDRPGTLSRTNYAVV